MTDRVAMVLTDLEMPEMDGFTLTRNIKQDARFSGLPVVVHSSPRAQPMKTMCAAWALMATWPSSWPKNWRKPSAGFCRTDADSAAAALAHTRKRRGAWARPWLAATVNQTVCPKRHVVACSHREYRLLGQFTAPAKVAPTQERPMTTFFFSGFE